MTTEQPLALHWAGVLMRDVGSQLVNRKQAAAELRRLHAENDELRAAIQAALSESGDNGWELYFQNEIIRNGLKAALKGGKT